MLKSIISSTVFASLLLLSPSLYCFDNGNDEEDQEEKEGWSFSGNFSLVFNQASFSNWAAGGENTFSSSALSDLEATYKMGDISWENTLDTRYGLYKSEGTSLKKNEDRIDINSKFSREIREKLNSSVIINHRTQFTDGYDYPNDSVIVSKFMAPGYLTLSGGIDYKPQEYLSIFVSPVSGRFTFVLDQKLSDQGAFGVDSGQTIKPELGGIIIVTLRKKFYDENIRLRSRMELFNRYKQEKTEKWYNSIINWETATMIKVTEHITINALFHLIYDLGIQDSVVEINGEEIQVGDDQLQFKQIFGLGFSYSF